jgi:hypothetical protein
MEKKNAMVSAVVFKFEEKSTIVILYVGGDFDVCNENGIEYFDYFEELEKKYPEYSKVIDEALNSKQGGS